MQKENWFADLDWRLLIGAFLIALGLGLGGQYLYHQYAVLSPGLAKLEALPEIQGVTLTEQNQQKVLEVTLKEVDNLQQLMDDLQRIALAEFGPEISFILKDNRSPQLAETFTRINLSIQEALIRGNFQEMAQIWQAETAAAGVEEWVWLDSEYLYLKLQQGDHFLYEIFPRRVAMNAKTPGTQEGIISPIKS